MRIEQTVEKITTFEYKVFDQKHSGFLYDSTPQQCADYIRKKINGTAEFITMTEFYIKTGDVLPVNLKSITRNYEDGSDQDPAVINKRLARAKYEFVSNKNLLIPDKWCQCRTALPKLYYHFVVCTDCNKRIYKPIINKKP